MGDEEDDIRDAQPLLIFYDCETTGFSIYNDHITDIGAKVVASPIPLSSPTFSSLVKTSKRIPAAGKEIYVTVPEKRVLVAQIMIFRYRRFSATTPKNNSRDKTFVFVSEVSPTLCLHSR